MPIRVAVDAMGGDLAPNEVILGALAAVDEEPGLEVLLVGDEARVRDAVDWTRPPRVTLVHAPEAIGMDEHPVEALKKKRRSSIALGVGLVREGKAEAFFSAGNTGACVAAASMALRRIEGARRPGIAVTFPSGAGVTVLMDAGANIAPKAVDLLQYGVMAATYARRVLGKESPSVGLLNVGTEGDKGTELVQEAAKLLRGAPGLRFHGFVEGHDLFRGTTDVVVCDGFVGNAVLKAAEGQAAAMVKRVKAVLAATFQSELERHKVAVALHELAQQLDWAEYGGAPLLGVEGIVVIGHGRSEARAIQNGIKVAARAAGRDLNREIAAELAKLPVAV
ncbi:MAG TPA: phosphate acyltransferase PlsX [Planctomycetota bacterium]|nr:phosphate acyltransferase PlsX [Planctomycetota bacterium]